MPVPFVFRWREALVSPRGPSSPVTRHVLLTLSLHMNPLGKSCYPTVKTLCQETMLSKPTICSHLALAADAGWIEKHVKGTNGKGWRHHGYDARIPWPESEAEGVDVVKDVDHLAGLVNM